MKKLLCALLTVWLLAVTVSADVIWTPDDNFYNTHANQCEYLDRSYYTNGVEGGVVLYEKPGGRDIAVLENGVALRVSFTYEKDGTVWGVVEYGESRKTGWLDMKDMLLIYDNRSFTEEHEAEFVPYDGSFAELCKSEDRRVIFWSYPGSGQIVADFDHLEQGYSELLPDPVWTDADGRVWGRIGYYMAARGWVCLSDPANENLPVTERAYDLHPSAAPETVPVVQTSHTMDNLWVVCAAVAAVCGVTAVLLFRMRRKHT
ncbi:MAG: hypothetical protein E7429_04765 [Ruminococcaceae bacterium]|nr:hypothetical protein [Oscillospiraceae bacterium]